MAGTVEACYQVESLALAGGLGVEDVGSHEKESAMASYMSTEYLRLGALVGDTIRLFRTRSWSFVLVAGTVLVPLGLLDPALGQLSRPCGEPH